jgi:exosortase B
MPPRTAIPPALQPARTALWPAGLDGVAVLLLLLGLASLYLPTYIDLARRIWPTEEQGHGPIILAVSIWLLFSKRHEVAALPLQPEKGLGSALLFLGVLLYTLGRTQSLLVLEVLSQNFVLSALVLMFLGRAALRVIWFPLFFLLFMVPLPGSVLASVTGPLKAAVSAVAAWLLHALGYPVARSGVILTVGQYQLLVADACAGLNSMFTLEALGLLYMNLMKYASMVRNVLLAALIVPISFVANIFRVMILVLVTYHFGDEAGQGFVHNFAGMVLFMVGLALMLACDKLLRLGTPARERRP